MFILLFIILIDLIYDVLFICLFQNFDWELKFFGIFFEFFEVRIEERFLEKEGVFVFVMCYDVRIIL